MIPRDEHPDRAHERAMTALDEQAARDEQAEQAIRHTPAPLADTRTGEVAIPTPWVALAEHILDEAVPTEIKLGSAHALAVLVRAAGR